MSEPKVNRPRHIRRNDPRGFDEWLLREQLRAARTIPTRALAALPAEQPAATPETGGEA